MMNDRKVENVILFDGVCNLCNGAVQFVIEHDSQNIFKFASLQSAYGQAALANYNLLPQELSTVVLLSDHKIFTQSTAVLKIAGELSGAVKVLKVLMIIPKPIRDFFYNTLSKNRYSLFGKRESCFMPTPELKEKFLE